MGRYRKVTMHNPRVVVALATWLTVVHIGHIFVMSWNKEYESCTHSPTAEDQAVAKRRIIAGSTAYLVSIVAAIAYLVTRRHRSDRVTYWAVAAVILFGLSHAIYLAWPKLYRDDPTPEDQARRRRGARLSESVYFIAIVSAIVAWYLSGHMKPLPSVNSKTQQFIRFKKAE